MSLHDDNDDDLLVPRDRELTLSTGAIIAIFFGLVLLCGAFFAFGYNMGTHKAVPAPAAADDPEPASSSSSTSFNTFKPSAGSPAAAPAVAPAASPSVDPSSPAPATRPAPHAQPTANDDSAPVLHAAQQPSAVTPSPGNPSSFMVQIAAVSHQEDADLLMAALKSKGYTATARQSPADQLIHIQVGPFTTRKDAEATRARLLNDGYNAIIK